MGSPRTTSTEDIIEAMLFPGIEERDPINETGELREVVTCQFAGTSQPADFRDFNSRCPGWILLGATGERSVWDTLDHIETFLSVELFEVTGNADPGLNVGKVSPSSGTAGVVAYGYSCLPSTNDIVRYDSFTVFIDGINLTTDPSLTCHELGHALGLKHPFNRLARPDGKSATNTRSSPIL